MPRKSQMQKTRSTATTANQSLAENCKNCASEIDNDDLPVPATLPSPAVRSGSVLQNFPAEILLIVTKFLPPVPLMSLSYTCRYFQYFLNCSIEDVLRSSETFSQDIRHGGPIKAFKAKRLELLCLLDRDGMIPSSELICSACSQTHAKWRFSPESTHASNTERACVGMEGRVWLCPHQKWNYEQVHRWPVQTFEEILAINFSCKACLGIDTHRHGKPPFLTTFPILDVSDPPDCQGHKIKKALSKLHASICPHHQLNSAFVSEVYTRHCQFLDLDVNARPRHSCNCDSCARLARCSSCDTVVKFDEQISCFGRRTLRVHVQRILSARKPTDSNWTSQLVRPAEFADLERRWSKTLKICEQVKESNRWCPHSPRGLCCDMRNGHRHR